MSWKVFEDDTTYPCPTKNEGDEGRRNGEEIDKTETENLFKLINFIHLDHHLFQHCKSESKQKYLYTENMKANLSFAAMNLRKTWESSFHANISIFWTIATIHLICWFMYLYSVIFEENNQKKGIISPIVMAS